MNKFKGVIIKNNDYLINDCLSNLNLVQHNPNGTGKYIVDYLSKLLVDNINNDTND